MEVLTKRMDFFKGGGALRFISGTRFYKEMAINQLLPVMNKTMQFILLTLLFLKKNVLVHLMVQQ